MPLPFDETKVFGNTISSKSLKSADRVFRRYARRFDFDPSWRPNFAARPMDIAWDILGVRELYIPDSQADGGSPASPLVFDKKSVLIGTIRMGFGHYRIALAIASAAKSMGLDPYWLDFLAFPESTASKTIHHLEGLYSWGSRLSQKSKLFNKYVWEKITSDVSRRISYCARDRAMSKLFAPLCSGLDTTVPFYSTHPWTGQAAVRANFNDVITVVPDNYPLAFHLVEGSSHAVQTPSAYLGYRGLRGMQDKGSTEIPKPIPQENIRFTGHFVDHELVSSIEEDCSARFKRLRNNEERRLLLTIGGAGAQMQRFTDIVRFLGPSIEAGKAALFINLGDHAARCAAFQEELARINVPYTLHKDWADSKAFAEEVLHGRARGVHLFLHDTTVAAVYITNLLMRASDIMITKPSELSFYPVPKLFIERVGRHEAWGAIRGAEIGDGTMETAGASGLRQMLTLIIEDRDLLHLYCTNILKNKEIGLYDGAYNAVKYGLERRT